MVPYFLLPAHSAQHRLKLVFKKDNVTSAFLYRLCRRPPALAQEKQHAHVLPWPVLQALFTSLSQILTTQHVETAIKERGSVRQ